jgi:hypothetical protein
MLPTDAKARKEIPIATGVLDYFPKALAAIARVSFIGNEQHNPGTPLHWDRSKSTDEADALMRHFLERGTLDKDGQPHSAKVAWRALALLEKELEGTPLMAEYPWKTDAPLIQKGPPLCSSKDRETGNRCVLYLGHSGLCDRRKYPNSVPEAAGDAHMPPIEDLCNGSGRVEDTKVGATPLMAEFPRINYCSSFCADCGADLGETGHFTSCLSQAAHR